MDFILETNRLELRKLKLDDWDELSKILSDEESMQYYPHPFSHEEVLNWIKWNLAGYEKYNHGLWAVILKENHCFIGDCGITMQEVEGDFIRELGYHINKNYCGRGFATEAAIACKNYAFQTMKLDKLYSYMKTDNIPSRRVAEKVGMKWQKNFTKILYGKEIEEALYYMERERMAR